MLLWEKYYPFVLAFAVVFVLGCADIALGNDWNAQFPESAANLLGASITGGSIFTAFLATMLSFLMGLDTPAARRVFETEYGNLLLSYFKCGIIGSLLFCLVSLLSYFRQDTIIFYIWIFFGVFAVSTFWRCADLLFYILKKDETKY